MRTFDENGRGLCRFQALVFQTSLEKLACSSPIFIRRFMFSSVAKRMDRYNEFPTNDVDIVFQEIEEVYGTTSYGQIHYDKEELYWIGYIYRCWSYIYEEPSVHVYRTIKPAELRQLYFSYHTLDPLAAIDRIREAKGIQEEDMIQKGVRLLRAIRKEIA